MANLLNFGHHIPSEWVSQVKHCRFEHWERPASDSEEVQINRAASMVRTALVENAWLQAEGVAIAPQGSYFNNTNVRLESDMDLRAVHPLIRIEYHQGVLVDCAQRVHQIPQSGRYFTDVIADMRREIAVAMGAKFGAANIDASGNKAVRIKKQPGSRADVDVVPVFKYLWVWWNQTAGQYWKAECAFRSKVITDSGGR